MIQSPHPAVWRGAPGQTLYKHTYVWYSSGMKIIPHACQQGDALPLPLYSSRVPAGFPSPADDFIEHPLDLNEQLIRHPAATFFVRVEGDSMIDAGIQDGDVAVLERTGVAREGDIVAAYVDGRLTLKKLARISGTFVLVPCNKMYPVIRPEHTLEIYAILVGLVRKYR